MPGEIGNDGERLSTLAGAFSATHHLHRYGIAAALCAGKRVLDLASGEGYGTHIIAQSAKEVVGVDVSEDAVSHASKKYVRDNLRYLLGSAESIPLENASVDVVTSFETIEHHLKHREMLGEFKRVLKPDGLLMLSSPDKLYYSDLPKIKNPFHVKELYEEELRVLVQDHFRNLDLYGQKMVGGSMVCALAGGRSDLTIWAGGFDRVGEADGLVGSQYLICLASDGSLPVLGSSFFDGELIAEARRQGEAVIRDLKNSLSFRIGRAITAPMRWLRRN